MKDLSQCVEVDTIENSFVPSWSASRRPRSADTTLSYSRSHLLPTSTTWALSHEYVLIWVHLRQPATQQAAVYSEW